jgi:methionine-S-sulfoxide reductase
MKKIWLAGGCFWGVEGYFQQLRGIIDTTVGYGQGKTENPTYHQVCSGQTGHAEICEVTYDEAQIVLPKVLEQFFRIIDPTSLNRQGADQGTQYRSGIYYRDANEVPVINAVLQQIQKRYSNSLVVEVEPLKSFYPAEEYHQDYLKKNPHGYCHIDMSLAAMNERN